MLLKGHHIDDELLSTALAGRMMYVVSILDVMAVLVSLFFFSVGSISDFKSREVDDKVWMAYAPIGGALTVGRLIVDPSLVLIVGVSAGISVLVAIGLFYFGLTGGADAKAIMCLGITQPTPPVAWHPLLGFVHPFFPIVVVMMGFICSGFTVAWFGARNIGSYITKRRAMFDGLEHESRLRKALAFISAYPTQISTLKSKFYLYPAEEVVKSDETGSAQMRFKFFLDAETDRDQLVSSFADAISQAGYQGLVWVTPGLPMLIFILIGLAVALVIGDPVFTTIVRAAVR
jgi:preflagellin peptidase FlaK